MPGYAAHQWISTQSNLVSHSMFLLALPSNRILIASDQAYLISLGCSRAIGLQSFQSKSKRSNGSSFIYEIDTAAAGDFSALNVCLDY